MRKTSLLYLSAVLCVVGMPDASAATPTPANPAVTPIRTPTPRRVILLELKGEITPVAGIRSVAGPGTPAAAFSQPAGSGKKTPTPTPTTTPPGSCSQIKITAFRTADEYDTSGALREHESTFAKGMSLQKCTYSLMVPAFVTVRFDATTTIPGWKVVVSYNENSSSVDMFWSESPVTINWKLKPIKTGVLPAAPRK